MIGVQGVFREQLRYCNAMFTFRAHSMTYYLALMLSSEGLCTIHYIDNAR